MAATGHVRSGCSRQRRQTFLFHDDYHFLTTHDPVLRETWRWMPARSTSLKSFRRKFLIFRREAVYTPLNCAHCSSIIMPRLGFCRVAFLPRLLAYLFLEQVPQTCARLVQL